MSGRFSLFGLVFFVISSVCKFNICVCLHVCVCVCVCVCACACACVCVCVIHSYDYVPSSLDPYIVHKLSGSVQQCSVKFGVNAQVCMDCYIPST